MPTFLDIKFLIETKCLLIKDQLCVVTYQWRRLAFATPGRRSSLTMKVNSNSPQWKAMMYYNLIRSWDNRQQKIQVCDKTVAVTAFSHSALILPTSRCYWSWQPLGCESNLKLRYKKQDSWQSLRHLFALYTLPHYVFPYSTSLAPTPPTPPQPRSFSPRYPSMPKQSKSAPFLHIHLNCTWQSTSPSIRTIT